MFIDTRETYTFAKSAIYIPPINRVRRDRRSARNLLRRLISLGFRSILADAFPSSIRCARPVYGSDERLPGSSPVTDQQLDHACLQKTLDFKGCLQITYCPSHTFQESASNISRLIESRSVTMTHNSVQSLLGFLFRYSH